MERVARATAEISSGTHCPEGRHEASTQPAGEFRLRCAESPDTAGRSLPPGQIKVRSEQIAHVVRNVVFEGKKIAPFAFHPVGKERESIAGMIAGAR